MDSIRAIFQEMAAALRRHITSASTCRGRHIVGSGARWRSPTGSSDDPRLTMVTPIAQKIEMAKSELKSNDSKVIRCRKRIRYDDTIFKKNI